MEKRKIAITFDENHEYELEVKCNPEEFFLGIEVLINHFTRNTNASHEEIDGLLKKLYENIGIIDSQEIKKLKGTKENGNV